MKSPNKIQIRYFKMPGAGWLARRFTLPILLAYFAGFFAMGWLALEPDFQAATQKHIPISPSPHSIRGPALQAGRDLHALVWHYLTHEPEGCMDRGASAANDYQRQQCREYTARLEKLGWLASLPFLMAGLAAFVLVDGLRMRYGRARRAIREGRSIGRGIVTDPPEAPADWLSWSTGTRPVTLQGAGGHQLTAYLPPEMEMPAAGTQLSLYKWGFSGVFSGSKPVHFAVLYAPHLAVLEGG